MEVEESYDTPDFIKGIIYEKHLNGLKQQEIVDELAQLGYSVHQTTDIKQQLGELASKLWKKIGNRK